MTIIIVRVCIWVLGFPKLKALGAMSTPLKFSLMILLRLFCSCLNLFDASVETLLCIHLNKFEVGLVF